MRSVPFMSVRIQQLFCRRQQVLLAFPPSPLYRARMNLGKRLRHARKLRGLTQEQLVQMVKGSSQAMISALEKRDSETTTLLFEFADALRVEPRWLLTGQGISGLEDKRPAVTPDPLLMQLIDLWSQLGAENRDKLLSNANWLHAQEHPMASASNPFGERAQK